jgi:hypothetical protein
MPSNISHQVFAPFAITANDGVGIIIDVNSFIMRILLFDTYIIESSMLRDIMQLEKVFGIEGLIDLIKSGAVKIHIDALTIGQGERDFGAQKFPVEMPSSKDVMPLLHYAPVVVNIAERNTYVERSLKNLHIPKTGKKSISRLQNAVIDKLTIPPGHNPQSVQWARASLLSNTEVVSTALQQAITEVHNKSLIPTNFNYTFRASGDAGYTVATNVGEIFNLNPYDEHKLFELTVLKVMGFYQRLSLMNSYYAIAWFNDSDSLILDAEIKLRLHEYNSSLQEKRFTRILNIKELPAILPGDKINAYSFYVYENQKNVRILECG